MDFKKTSSGFLFTALALVLLTFMLASLSASSAAAAQQEQTYAYRFKVEALNSLLQSTNDAQLSNFAQMSLLYSLSELSKKSVTEPLRINADAPANNARTGNVNVSLYGLMLNGSTNGGTSGFIQPLLLPSQNYTLASWERALNASATAAGFSLSFGEAVGFEAYQPDGWSVNARFTLPVNITDSDGSFSVQKILHADATTGIEGIYDPMVAREDARRRLGNNAPDAPFAQKQIFRNPNYIAPSSVAPRTIANESAHPNMEGLGWFYGPVLSISKDEIAGINASEARTSIYMPTEGYYDGILTDGYLFGAVIIRTPPVTQTTTLEEGNCNVTTITETMCVNCVSRTVNSCGGSDSAITNKVNFSYIVTDGTGWYNDAQSVQGKKHVLFDNEFGTEQNSRKADGYHRIFDMENLRDMAVCGFYVQNENAPSFFQKMLAEAPALHSLLGIESFVVGKWAGGGDDLGHVDFDDHNALSRLDRKFYLPPDLQPVPEYTKIKGMPGCKSRDMCSSEDAINNGVGQFGLDKDSIAAYGAGAISCNGTFGGGCG